MELFVRDTYYLYRLLVQAAGAAALKDWKTVSIIRRTVIENHLWQVVIWGGAGATWLLYRNVKLSPSTWFKTKAKDISVEKAAKAVEIAHAKSESAKLKQLDKNGKMNHRKGKLSVENAATIAHNNNLITTILPVVVNGVVAGAKNSGSKSHKMSSKSEGRRSSGNNTPRVLLSSSSARRRVASSERRRKINSNHQVA